MRTQKFNGRALSLAVASILAVGVGAFSATSYAATATANLDVSAIITNTCTISTTALAFGEYVTGSGNVAKDGTGTVSTICTIGTLTGVVTLGQGIAPVGDVAAAPVRQMQSAANRLGYFLYQDSGHATVWGNTPETGKATGIGLGGLLPQVLTVYGVIPATQNVPAGSYGDTVVATVTW